MAGMKAILLLISICCGNASADTPSLILASPGKLDIALFTKPPPHKKLPQAYTIGCPEIGIIWDKVAKQTLSNPDYDSYVSSFEVFDIVCSGPQAPPKFQSTGEPGSLLMTSRLTGQRQRNYLNPTSVFHNAIEGEVAKVSKADIENAYPDRGVDFESKGNLKWCFWFQYEKNVVSDGEKEGFAENFGDAERNARTYAEDHNYPASGAKPNDWVNVEAHPYPGSCKEVEMVPINRAKR